MLRTKAAILAKIEVNYGVDPVPVAGTNAIYCELPEFSVIGRKLERSPIRNYMGKHAALNVGDGLKIKFTTELKGSGAVATAPEIGPLFRACNMTQTIVALTSVAYDPNSSVGNVDSAESIAIYYYQDLILHKLLGCRGNFSVDLKAGEYGKITWEFTGVYGGPAASTTPAGTFNATLPARFQSAAFLIDAYAAIIEALTIDMGNKVVARKDANSASGINEYMIVNREPKANINPEVPAHATKSFWGLWSASSEVAMTAALGSVAGNILTITAPKVQLDVPTYADREEVLIHGLPLSLHPNAGNDEIKFLFT